MSSVVKGTAQAGNSPLIAAVRAGDTAAVRAALQQKVDVNASQGDGATALHWAVHLDNLATADLLLRAGAKVNAADDTGVTPLYLSCMHRHAAMVERLLAAGANPNAALLNGETPLMMCARAGDPAAVRALLLKGAQVNAKEKAHQQTALMWAASEKRPEVVKQLLEVGADINARSVVYPRTVTAEETQRAGREELNYTILRGGSTALLFAAREGDVESVRILLAAGANPNDTSPDGATALIEAAHSGEGAAAALLLEKGADPNNADIGYTALHAAVLRGDLTLVKALLAHHANPNLVITRSTQTKRANGHEFELLGPMLGATPYMLASQYLETEMMRVLAAGGADTRLPKKDGMTPLMLAAGMMASTQVDRRSHRTLDGAKIEDESQVLEGVKTALALGADINATNQQGITALQSATGQGFTRVAQLLKDNGASLTVEKAPAVKPAAALQTAQVWSGILSDSMCGASHQAMTGAGGMTDRECAFACIKAHATYVLVTESKQVIPIATQSFAGLPLRFNHAVRITGEMTPNGIMMSKLELPPAHTHIGHVMTAWRDTPGSVGLLIAAIADSKVAANHALLVSKVPDDLQQMQLHAGHVLNALDPSIEAKGPGSGYGVKKAATGALQHAGFAAKSEGASANVIAETAQVSASLNGVIQWTDESVALAQRIRAASSAAEAAPLATQLAALTSKIVSGLQEAHGHMGLMSKGEGL